MTNGRLNLKCYNYLNQGDQKKNAKGRREITAFKKKMEVDNLGI